MAILDDTRLGFSSACFAGNTLDEAANIGLAMGFSAYEMLGFDGYSHSQGVLSGFYFEHMTDAQREALRQVASRFEHISTHAPFIDIASFAPNPSVRETARRQLEIAVQAVAYLGGSTTTTHIAPAHGGALLDFKDDVVRYYRRLGDLAGEAGVSVTIETGYPGSVHEFADLLWSIDHPAVGANVDVGHLVSTIPSDLRGTQDGVMLYNDTLEEHLRSLGEKILHFHLHDIRFEDFRDHRAAGRGFLDYERLMRVAAELDYQGLFVFELEEPDAQAALAESKSRIESAVKTASSP